MARLRVFWDLDDDPDGNVQHIAEHDITQEEVEEVLDNPMGRGISRSSGRPMVYGMTTSRRWIVVVYDEIDDDSVYPLTAYDAEE